MNISWLKLDVNILDNSKIKIIRSYPSGDSIVVLWIGILCLAMKSPRPGFIEISDGIPYTIDDLAKLFDIEKKTTELGISLLQKFRMIDILEGGCIDVINFSREQNIEFIERTRELTRNRVAKYRAKLLPPPENKEPEICNALQTRDIVTVTPTDKIRLDKKRKETNTVSSKIKFLDSVYLTQEEINKLKTKYQNGDFEKAVEILNNYKMSSGKKYKSDYHALIGWVSDRIIPVKQNYDPFKGAI